MPLEQYSLSLIVDGMVSHVTVYVAVPCKENEHYSYPILLQLKGSKQTLPTYVSTTNPNGIMFVFYMGLPHKILLYYILVCARLWIQVKWYIACGYSVTMLKALYCIVSNFHGSKIL